MPADNTHDQVDDPILLAAFSADFALLQSDPTPYPVEASVLNWWCLVCAVQLASRHPEAAHSDVLRRAIRFARAIGEHIASTPAVAAVMRHGWNSRYDELTNASAAAEPSREPAAGPELNIVELEERTPDGWLGTAAITCPCGCGVETIYHVTTALEGRGVGFFAAAPGDYAVETQTLPGSTRA